MPPPDLQPAVLRSTESHPPGRTAQLALFPQDAPHEPVQAVPAPLPDVDPDALPETYRPLLARLDAVRPDCARAARLAIAEGEASGDPYDVAFLATFVERMERQAPSDPDDRPPVEPRPFTDADLRRHVEAAFPTVAGLWDALVASRPDVPAEAVGLVNRLTERLASWGLHRDDVRPATRGPANEPSPHDVAVAATVLTAATARLAKDLADQQAGRDPEGTARRLARDARAFRRAAEAAERVLAGGPRRLPAPAVETVGDRRTWWTVIAVPGKSTRKPFSLKRGRRTRTFAERPGVLGPFRTRRQAREAGQRATHTPEDSRIGLFATTAPPGLPGSSPAARTGSPARGHHPAR